MRDHLSNNTFDNHIITIIYNFTLCHCLRCEIGDQNWAYTIFICFSENSQVEVEGTSLKLHWVLVLFIIRLLGLEYKSGCSRLANNGSQRIKRTLHEGRTRCVYFCLSNFLLSCAR